jgi:hypothetical protein
LLKHTVDVHTFAQKKLAAIGLLATHPDYDKMNNRLLDSMDRGRYMCRDVIRVGKLLEIEVKRLEDVVEEMPFKVYEGFKKSVELGGVSSLLVGPRISQNFASIQHAKKSKELHEKLALGELMKKSIDKCEERIKDNFRAINENPNESFYNQKLIENAVMEDFILELKLENRELKKKIKECCDDIRGITRHFEISVEKVL